MLTSVWVFCNRNIKILITHTKGAITSVWVFCNESSLSNDRFAKELGISIAGEKLDCRDMQSFSAQVGSKYLISLIPLPREDIRYLISLIPREDI